MRTARSDSPNPPARARLRREPAMIHLESLAEDRHPRIAQRGDSAGEPRDGELLARAAGAGGHVAASVRDEHPQRFVVIESDESFGIELLRESPRPRVGVGAEDVEHDPSSGRYTLAVELDI